MTRWIGILLVAVLGIGIAERVLSKDDNAIQRAGRRFRRRWWD